MRLGTTPTWAAICVAAGFLLTVFHTQVHDELVLLTPGLAHASHRFGGLRAAFGAAPTAVAPREDLEAFAERKSYARRLDKEVYRACVTEPRPAPARACAPAAGAVRLLQYNVFRMVERGASELVGSWLDARGDDYVTLNELNGFHNESEFAAWAGRHGFARACFLPAASNYNVGFLARSDATCACVAARFDGFAHGVLHAAWKSNIQPDFNVQVIERFGPDSFTELRELDKSDRFVQRSAESTSI